MEKQPNSLPEAIRQVVTTFSRGLLCESRVINILTDYNAFKDLAQAKFILKSIILEGYIERLFMNQEWDESCDKLVERFISYTGIQADYARYVFLSICYGIEWSAEIPQLEEPDTSEEESVKRQKTKKATKTSATKSKPKRHKKCENMTDDEFEDYIWSKIEWDHNLEKKAGLTFSNYQISSFNGYTGFCILFEMKGKIKTEHLSLKYIAYDDKGRLRASGTCFYQTKEDKMNRTGEMNVFFNKPLDTLDKVIIDADYNF